MARPGTTTLRPPDWSAAERAALDELVVRYGAAGHWPEIAGDLERRFGPVRPYRRLRLDLRHRRQQTTARTGTTLVTVATVASGTTALEALLGAAPIRVKRRRVVPGAKGGGGRRSDPVGDVAAASGGRDSAESVDTDAMAAAALIPGLDSAFATVRRPLPSSPGLPNASFEIADSIVRRYRARTPIPRPRTAPTGGPRSSSDLLAEPGSAFKRRARWADDEQRALRELVLALPDGDWAAVAEAMRARFGQRRLFTSRNVQQQHYRGITAAAAAEGSESNMTQTEQPLAKRPRVVESAEKTTESEESAATDPQPEVALLRTSSSEERVVATPSPERVESPVRGECPPSSPFRSCESEVEYRSSEEDAVFVVPLPKSEVPLTKVEVPVPKAEVPLPKSDVSLPKAEVPLPKSEVTLPKAEVPLPKSEVRLPKVEVTLPKVKVAERTVEAGPGPGVLAPAADPSWPGRSKSGSCCLQ